MDVRIAGAAWPDKADELLDMARTLHVGIRFAQLPRAKPFIPCAA